MHLEKGEKVHKIYYHHYLPFIFQLLKVFMATLPFYFLLYIFRQDLSSSTILIAQIFIILLFTFVTIYVTFVYWLDRLIITNRRIVYIDWKYLTVKTEHETELKDIQDITSTEKGVFSIIPFLDYGLFTVTTAANVTTIVFPDAPDPNGIKYFIQSLLIHD